MEMAILFGFKRSEVDPKNQYCWVDTIFDPSLNVEKGQSVEYYYSLLKEQEAVPENSGRGDLVDGHEPIDTTECSKKISDSMTEEDVNKLARSNLNSSGYDGFFSKTTKIKRK